MYIWNSRNWDKTEAVKAWEKYAKQDAALAFYGKGLEDVLEVQRQFNKLSNEEKENNL